MPVRKRPLLDSLCCCLNVLFHPQQEKHVPYFDNGRHQVEIRAREDVMMTYGMATGGVVPGTLTRTGTRGMVDPRLCTPSHGRSQYYMGTTLERGSGHGPQQYYHVEEDQGPGDQDQMNYMNDLDAAMTRPIAYPQYDGDEGQGYYQQAPHLLPTSHHGVVDLDMEHDPYNHMQNMMHRKESNDRRVEDELWQGCVPGGMQDQQQQFFMSQSQLAMGQEGFRTGTRGRGTRKKVRNENGQYQVGMGLGMGSAASSSYNVHGGEMGMDGGAAMEVGIMAGMRHGRGGSNGEEPIYEEILSSGGSVGGRQNGYPMVGTGQSRHLSAFLNEKGNSVISCLEPIK